MPASPLLTLRILSFPDPDTVTLDPLAPRGMALAPRLHLSFPLGALVSPLTPHPSPLTPHLGNLLTGHVTLRVVPWYTVALPPTPTFTTCSGL